MNAEPDMRRRLPRFCVEDTDRHGNVRVYLRRLGRPKVRLPGVPWTPDFMAAYETAIASPTKPARDRHATRPDSWKWLCQQYLGSAAFADLEEGTRRRKRALLESTYDEPVKPGSKLVYGDVPHGRLTEAAIAILRDRMAHVPHASDNRLKAIRTVFRWGASPEVRKADHNPALAVAPLSVQTDGHHTWTVEEVDQFIARHPVGTKAYLALCLLMFAGGRSSDAVVLGRQHTSGGWLTYTQRKNRKRSPSKVVVPILPDLQAAIDACPSGTLTFLVTSFGLPFSPAGFGNWFKDRCREAGLPHCSAHGLRKAAATFAAERGATERQLMAMFGWKTSQMPTLYTRQANKRRLAGAAMPLIAFANVPPAVPVGQTAEKH